MATNHPAKPMEEEEPPPAPNIQDLINEGNETFMSERLEDVISKSKKAWLEVEEWELLFENAHKFEITEGTKIESMTEGLYRVDFKENENEKAEYVDANEWSNKGENIVEENPYGGNAFQVEYGRLSLLERPYKPYGDVPYGILNERMVISSRSYPKIRFAHYFTSRCTDAEAQASGLRYPED